MPERCPSRFKEALLSGFLDGELTQASEQKVRVHLEDCRNCRTLFDDLKRLRGVTMNTKFVEPSDEQWDEAPRGSVSLMARGLGWVLGIVWLLAVGGFALWSAWQEAENLLERLLIFGGLSALALLLLSVILDRIRAARSDRYREVKK